MRKTNRWTGLSCILSFLLCFAIFGTNCAISYDSVVNDVLGISASKVVTLETEESVDTQYYKSAYGEMSSENLKTLKADTYAQAIQEQEEGTVLLRNENNALPLTAEERNVTLFGHAIVQPLFRNQSAGSRAYDSTGGIDPYKAFNGAGFKINTKLYVAYRNSATKRMTGAGSFFAENDMSKWSLGEEPISFYTDDLKATWDEIFNDVAIVMLAREGGEGVELYMETPTEGISQLALSQDEKDLLQMIKDSGKFKKTIVLINSGNPMELGWLDEYDVDAALWIGCPGEKGFAGVVDILTGAANPSGHLIETYASDSLSSPAAHTNSYNNQIWSNIDEALAASASPASEISYYAVQSEGIYIGYKYYETRYEDWILNRYGANGTAGSSTGAGWNYADEVMYPFGYGLSYTTFEQTLDSVSVGDHMITVNVTVTNTGTAAGKSAVQVYAQTPYGAYEQENLVEKSAIQLLDFGKTGILQPGESETVTIECDKYLLASYDYSNAKGYILSEGDYYIAVGDDAHDAINNVLAAKGASGLVDVQGNATVGNADKTYRWTEVFDDVTYRHSAETGVEVTNLFDDCDANYWYDDVVTYLSRSDWQGTFPVEPVSGLGLTEEMIAILDGNLYQKSADAPSISEYVQGKNQGIMLIGMRGVEYEDNLWETFLNQMTIDEMASLVANNFGSDEVPSIGKPRSQAGDGPDGIGGFTDNYDAEKYGKNLKTTSYPNESLLAATFNKELMRRRGELLGDEGLFLGVVEIWGPGCNLHRTPFGGRSFEYFSEDANMNYLAAIPIVQGVESKGVHAGPKHLTGNDQEINRQGIVNFFNEQAFREGALRGLEGAVAKGQAHSLMQAFNRLGFMGCSVSEGLNKGVVRGEWGYVGHIETDAIGNVTQGYKTAFTSMLAAGTDSFCLDTQRQAPKAIMASIIDNDDGYLISQLRRAAKNILFNDVNSNIINGLNSNSVIVQITPWWQPMLYGVIGLFALLTAWSLTMLTLAKIKNRKTRKGEVQS